MSTNKKYVTAVVAVANTLIGLAAVLSPSIPVEYKGAVLVAVSTLSYLLLSPIASFFGVVVAPKDPQ